MSSPYAPRVCRRFSIVAGLLLATTLSVLAGESAIDPMTLDDASNPAKNLARMNCGASIDLIGADGRVMVVTDKESSPTALLLDDNTLNYPLPEGDTTFVLSFPRTSILDRFTFVNENSSAAGEMAVAVSNYRLPARSSKWIEVNVGTSFTGKRLFDLPLAGTEARYVKLSFHVTEPGTI